MDCPGVRITFDEETFTTAGTAFFTTGANPAWNETWEEPPVAAAVVRTGTKWPVLAMAQDPAMVPTANATTNPAITLPTGIWNFRMGLPHRPPGPGFTPTE